MRVSFCGEQIAHVEVSPTGAFSARPSLVVVSCQPPAEVSTEALGDTLVVRTAQAAVPTLVARTAGSP